MDMDTERVDAVASGSRPERRRAVLAASVAEVAWDYLHRRIDELPPEGQAAAWSRVADTLISLPTANPSQRHG